MAENTKILTAEQESQLRAPIDEYVGAIQEKINALRADGTDKVIDLHNSIDGLKRDKIYTQEEKAASWFSTKRSWSRPRRWRPRIRTRSPSSSPTRRAI